MKIEEVRTIARSRNIKTVRLSKGEIIKAIQRSEGNFDCFGSPADGGCDQLDCAWRKDCIPAPRPAKM